ncbi:MAG: aspartate kinase [Thermoproteota archaeon]|nr:aspartate kinase [Thermoproteota archaeon]
MKIVMKFGGTSIADGKRIEQVIDIVHENIRGKNKVILVISALAGVTDNIITAIGKALSGDQEAITRIIEKLKLDHHRLAKEVVKDEVVLDAVLLELNELVEEFKRVIFSVSYLREVTPRSRDNLLSFGEKLSASIICAALKADALKVKWLSGGEAGIVTDDHFGAARPLMNITNQQVKERIGNLLDEGIIPVVTGFIAYTQNDVTTTLGRSGSDYSATILGAALDVNEVWIWKDVDGLMTADPKIEPLAQTIQRISYSEAMEMAYFGATVMHPKALEPVAEKNIPVRVKNAFNLKKPGTLVMEEKLVKLGDAVKSVAMIKDVALITVSGAGMVGTPGVAARVFSILSENHVNILMISQGSSEANISFIVSRESSDRTVNTLEIALLGGDTVKDIISENDVCVVAAVGAGMKGIPGVAARVFKAVADVGVNVRMIAQGSSELNISFVVQEEDSVKAVRALHREFRLDKSEIT